MDRKAAAEARRAKLLARGDDRLARITGSLHHGATVGDVPQDTQNTNQAADSGPAAADGAVPPPTPQAAPAADSASASQPAPAARAAVTAQPPAAVPTQAPSSASPAAALACEMGAAVRSRAAPPTSLPKGTATNSKWAQYEAPAGGTAPPRRQLRRVSAGETLSAAVLSTGRLRLLLAALLAVLLAARWDAAAVASSKPQVQEQPPAAVSSPWTELGARLQGMLSHARSAVLGTPPAPPPKQDDPAQQPLLAKLGKKLRAQLEAAADTPLGSPFAAAAKQVQIQLSAAAASPAGQRAATVLQQLRRQLSALAALPAVQQARGAVDRLLLASGQLGSRLTAAAQAPAVQAALDAAEQLPPLASLALLSLSLIGSAAVAMAAAPALVHSTLELDLHSPGLLTRLLSALLPGVSRQLALAAAWQRLLQGLLDDAAAFVLALVAYHHLPQLMEAAHSWLNS